ncbi:hypothetical protein [Geobacillus stearothermophilus]
MKGSRKEERHETQRTEEIQRMDDRVFSRRPNSWIGSPREGR